MLTIVLIGSIVSLIGTMIGASIGVLVKNPSRRLLGAIIGFAAGLMLSVVVFDLIPEALSKWSFKGTLIFCILGILLIALIDTKLNFNSSHKHIKVAVITAVGLMIHNFPEGIIMGSAFAVGGTLGFKMAIIIAVHDIPEGIAVAAPLMVSKVKIGKIMLFTLLTAMPTAIGAFLGVYVANISVNVLGACLSSASGIMLYVVCNEMLPESNKLCQGLTSSIGTLLGILVGFTMVQLL